MNINGKLSLRKQNYGMAHKSQTYVTLDWFVSRLVGIFHFLGQFDLFIPQSVFPGLFFYVYMESRNPKPQKAPHHRSQTPSVESPNPKTPKPSYITNNHEKYNE